MKKIVALAVIFGLPGMALAQSNTAQSTSAPSADLSYSYVGLRFVDYDDGNGDGLRFEGSFDLGNNWIIVGDYTSADFDGGVDLTVLELGGGYVWSYTPEWDLLGTARFVSADADTPFGSDDETGFRLTGGARGLVLPNLEVRGNVNYINLDSSDTYFEIGGDYYFTRQFSAGLTVEFGGDADLFTIGARYFFR